MNREQILDILPHRPPFMFVDRVLAIEPKKSCTAEWDVPTDAFWTQAHFPGNPVLPGVLQAEALAQTAAVAFLAAETEKKTSVYLVGFDKLRFRRVVKPGETLTMTVSVTSVRRSICIFDVLGKVGDERAITGSIMATLGEA